MLARVNKLCFAERTENDKCWDQQGAMLEGGKGVLGCNVKKWFKKSALTYKKMKLKSLGCPIALGMFKFFK